MHTARQAGLASLLLVLTLASAVHAEEKSPRDLIAEMVEAAGGREAFSKLGILKAEVSEVERTAKGRNHKSTFVGYLSTERTELKRLELPGEIVLGISDNLDGAWATIKGVPDMRPPTPSKARANVNIKLFPTMFPFCFEWSRLNYPQLTTAQFEGEEVWMFEMRPPKNYFGNPIFEEPWSVYVSKNDLKMLAAEFYPPPDQAQVVNEAVRFTVLSHKDVQGVQLPSAVMMEGLDLGTNLPNGHFRTINISWTVEEAPNYTIFYDPAILQRMEEEI